MQTATLLKQDAKSLDELLGSYYEKFNSYHPYGFMEGNLDALALKISRDCARFRLFSASEIAERIREDGVLIEQQTGASQASRNREVTHRYKVVLATK